MTEPRIYLESSVVSYLANRTSRDMRTALRQALTHEWWADVNKSQVWISDLVVTEVAQGNPEAAKRRLDFVKDLAVIAPHPQTQALAARLMHEGLVPESEPEDASHIAMASLHEFDFLVTWNFSHFVGYKPKFRVMNALQNWGYTPAVLVTPEELLEGKNHEY